MFAHVPIALGVQFIVWLMGRLLGAPSRAGIWIGGFAGTAVCVMREITQQEYRWIETFGHGLRANMPGYKGLKIWDWNSHSLSETFIPVAASVAVALAVTYRT
jgi:hypothetical protein